MNTLPKALNNSRCVLHIDLDCFYCQVEQVRLNVPSDIPAAVQQWHSLIAVNYPARKAGVQRHSTVDEALKICPNIRFLHVPTYAAGEKEPQYRKKPDRETQKVSLDPYRAASKKIFQIFHKHCDKLQKIGLDEAFMDVTATVNKRLRAYIAENPQMLEKLEDEECGIELDWNTVGITLETEEEEDKKLKDNQYWSKTTWRDLQLFIGAKLAADIRKEIFDTLNYTCSAGNMFLVYLKSYPNKFRYCSLQDSSQIML
ncbi:hypothetical protein BY458DRAFT_258372 [Sporodiniella umbellata]|nr:hypothetical protein BY458DRAFT_258372 [Sporodiniella umbellata]